MIKINNIILRICTLIFQKKKQNSKNDIGNFTFFRDGVQLIASDSE